MSADFVEKFCSVCHEGSWSNSFGSYYSTHETKKDSGKYVPCDTKGRVEINGVRQ